MSTDDFTLDFEGGKYTAVYKDHRLTVLRYGEPWRDFVGDKFISTLIDEIKQSREDLANYDASLGLLGKQVDFMRVQLNSMGR